MNDALTPLDLAIVGHTNTGKTSLLRTLLRDEHFGEVADQPGTTRQVESAQLSTQNGQVALILRDTPGLEDAMGALDYLDQIIEPGTRPDGPERIERLLQSAEASGQFEQECRVLEAVMQSDAALYVIDARDPILPKHRDELTLLADCGRPILPVLNFLRTPRSNGEAWRMALARLGLHATVDFDTVAPALHGEALMLDRLALMLDRHAEILQILRDDLAAQRQQRLHDAARLVAELLIDAAALRLSCSHEPGHVAATTLNLRKRMRDREQRCVQALLRCYRFRRATFPHHPLPLEGEHWGMDLFSAQALRAAGIQLGKGAATGALAGATIDVLTGGLSLGAATLIGAVIGGTWQGANHWGARLLARVAGNTEVSIDPPILQLLGLRQLALVRALEHRGHAAMKPIDGNLGHAPIAEADGAAAADPPAGADDDVTAEEGEGEPPVPQPLGTLPEGTQALLNTARGHPHWSTLADAPHPDARRTACVNALARLLFEHLEPALQEDFDDQAL